MALIVADRVKDATTTAGAGVLTLAGATIPGFRPLSAVMAVGDTCYYVIDGGAEWEVGMGTYTAANTLDRTTQIASSNAGASVVFSAGTKQVFITAAARQISADIPVTLGNATTTAETIIAQFDLPPRFFFAANEAADIRVAFHSGATAGTHTLRVRVGTAGTVADALVATIGATASVVANSNCEASILFMVPTVGAAGTCRATGTHRATATITGVAAAALPAATAINTTVRNFLSVTLQASVASAGTTQGAFIEKGQ